VRVILTVVAIWLASCLLLMPSAQAGTLLDVSGEVGPQPESKVETFTFEVPHPKTRLGLSAEVDLSQGTWAFRILDPAGEKISWMSCGGHLRLQNSPQPTIQKAGQATLEVSLEDAVGTWHVALSELSAPKGLPLLLLSGSLMNLVGVAFVFGWKAWSHTQWRWFLVGAAIWTVGVALKFLCAYFLNEPTLEGLKASLPHIAYVAAGSIYVGLLTGVFEIGITLLACLIWRSMAREPNRAVAVGVGAGAFEAILLGLLPLVSVLAIVVGVQGSEQMAAGISRLAAVTPVLWLVGPVERVLAILCHTSSRALVLLGVARRRWSFFWYGFGIMTAIDAIAGVAYLTGALGQISTWWIELAIAPFALAGLPIIAWCLRNWPQQTPPAHEQVAEME